MSAVIDQKAFNRVKSYIDFAKKAEDTKLIFGGNCDDSKGYYIEPTCVEVMDIKSKLLKEVFIIN